MSTTVTIKSITLNGILGPFTVQDAEIIGPLAVHRAIGAEGYSITHLETGKRIGTPNVPGTFNCRRCCVACARELSELDFSNLKQAKQQTEEIIQKWQS